MDPFDPYSPFKFSIFYYSSRNILYTKYVNNKDVIIILRNGHWLMILLCEILSLFIMPLVKPGDGAPTFKTEVLRLVSDV